MVRRFRVIQGGKQKQKSPSEGAVRLYRAYSTANLTRDDEIFHDVRFNWYCLERDQPPAPYEELIAEYERLDEKHCELLQRDVKRYFTLEETVELRAYLKERYGMDLHIEEIALPIKERSYLFGEGESVIYDFLELSEKENYALPFKVWGYYTITNCLSSPLLENGVRYLVNAFELLALNPGLSREQLEAVVKSLYKKQKLVVKDEKSG